MLDKLHLMCVIELQALTVLEYLVTHGSESVISDIREEHAYQISVHMISSLALSMLLSASIFCSICNGLDWKISEMPDSSTFPLHRFKWERSGNQC